MLNVKPIAQWFVEVAEFWEREGPDLIVEEWALVSGRSQPSRPLLVCRVRKVYPGDQYPMSLYSQTGSPKSQELCQTHFGYSTVTFPGTEQISRSTGAETPQQPSSSRDRSSSVQYLVKSALFLDSKA